MNRLVISPETLEKIKQLKKLENITKNTSYIEKLVEREFKTYSKYLEKEDKYF
jgi:hypothetical protein